ncbi:MAG: 2-oxo-4-hydroxy-4-carboxy-5-ureidoimidazoline decarboxylase, partial [Alphaproteobacteria bacterium]
GWEIASHGLKWIEHRDMAEDVERAQMAEAIRLHAQVVGTRPRGWYTGRCSVNTVRLAAEEGGFDWVADSYADDLPYWMRFGDRHQLIVPYTLDVNDMRFAIRAGFTEAAQFERYLIDSFDALHAEGQAGAPKMMSIGLHCRLAGRPGRIAGLARALAHMRARDGVWFATRGEIAAHWAATHPPRDVPRPSQMDRRAFLEAFGGIFEHSPWVAERAFDLELGPAHDSAVGLHNALCRAFRAASRPERLAVLRAHPDLAGKLAQARRLTPESAAEQASAGLDALTDEERAEFTRLNAEYVARHGFPFIIAVREHDKPAILAAFRRRIAQDSDTEFAEACAQVERIALHRLRALLP